MDSKSIIIIIIIIIYHDMLSRGIPKILLRNKELELVTSFKYLGLHDTIDGAIENSIRERIIRMEYRFKQFQGRVLTNRKVDILPRLNVFKAIVLTNGLYACETWNYTSGDIARLERHYFRLLRDTLLMPKEDPTIHFVAVLDEAEKQKTYFMYPLECLIQRQQLKFLWKIMHLADTAIQKVILFGKIASGATGRRGGRKRTYLTCLSLALKNFSVTMQECKEMTQIDWEFLIDNQALETATRKWRGRPCALKPIDNFWAPSIKSRGKRKRVAIVEEDDEEDSPEEFIIEEVVHQEGTPLNTMPVASEGNEIGERVSNLYLQLVKQRSPRKRKYRRLRSSNRMDRSSESTQVFPDSPTARSDHNSSRHNSSISTPTKTARRNKKNQQAADEFIKKLYEEGKLIDDEVPVVEPQTHVNTGIQMDNGSVPRRNISLSAQEKYDAQKKRNFERHQKRKVAATTRRTPTAVTAAQVENLQVFIGNGGGTDNTNEHSIVWEHRAQLGQTRAD